MQIPQSIQSIQTEHSNFIIHWTDGTVNKFPCIFLRDNCPCCRHANGQKLIETANISVSVSPLEYSIDNDNQSFQVNWTPDNHTSTYSFDWLKSHSLRPEDIETRVLAKQQEDKIILWDATLNAALLEGDYNTIKTSHAALAAWLGYVKDYGFGILRNVPAEQGMVLQVAGLFGYVRETNYGRLFDVKTVVNPNNLAYTGLGISPHTDNPYREPVPTLQLLHCLSSTADGGDSVLVDGFKIVEDLCRLHPRHFYLLHTTPVTFSFKDKDNWLERTATIIEVDIFGTTTAINFNNRSIQPFDIEEESVVDFYDAYLTLANMLEDKKYQVQFKMNSGDLYIVNNRRILHARSAYGNANGERWLQGAYADIDGLMSKWRVLSKQ